MQGMRRRVERVASARESAWGTAMEMTSTRLVRELRELVAAIDRRVPQVQRAGEADIARDAAALKVRALRRIKELEREQAYAEKV